MHCHRNPPKLSETENPRAEASPSFAKIFPRTYGPQECRGSLGAQPRKGRSSPRSRPACAGIRRTARFSERCGRRRYRGSVRGVDRLSRRQLRSNSHDTDNPPAGSRPDHADSPLNYVSRRSAPSPALGPRFAGRKGLWVWASRVVTKASSPTGRPMASARRRRSNAARSGPASIRSEKLG